MSLALITSRIRVEEKLLIAELEARGAAFTRVDDAALALDLQTETGSAGEAPWSVCWNRSLAFGRTLYTTEILEGQGVLCVNSAEVVRTAGDKALTGIALARAGVPSLRTIVAFTPESALAACDQLGYPCVTKPVVGSWGRLVSRLDTRAAAEAVFEHRAVLGSWQHSVFYVQEYVEKRGRDARVFVVGGEAIAAIWRHSEHWITNTALGGSVQRAEHRGELGEIAEAASRAMGGGLLAIDVVETTDGLAVLEVNHSGEFRNSVEPTGVNIPGAMVDWVLSQAGATGASAPELEVVR